MASVTTKMRLGPRRVAVAGLATLVLPIRAAADNPGPFAEAMLVLFELTPLAVIPLRFATDVMLSQDAPGVGRPTRIRRAALAACAEGALNWSAIFLGGDSALGLMLPAFLCAEAAHVAIAWPVMSGLRLLLTTLAYPPLLLLAFLVLSPVPSGTLLTARNGMIEWTPVAVAGAAALWGTVLLARRRRSRAPPPSGGK